MNKGTKIVGFIVCLSVIIGSIFFNNIVGNANDLNCEEDSLIIEKCLLDKNKKEENQNSITLGKENQLKITVMNDFHYFSEKLYSECDDFIYDCKAQKKLLLESDAILNKAIEQIKVEKPDVVLIGGDMSKDSEKINHQLVAEKLKKAQEELKQEGFNIKIYVINGNHDINSEARDYSSGETEYIPSVTISEFKKIYKEFGYGNGSEFYTKKENVGGGLSYVTDLGKGYTLIAVDTCIYTPDQTQTRKEQAEVDGKISDDLLKWIQKQAKKAYDKGNVPIVLQHHAITPHFTGEETIGGKFIIDDYEKIAQAYADVGINIVLTGHAHASDIATGKTNNGRKVYDIMTSSLAGYPITTRNVNLATENDKLYLDTKVNFIDSIDYINKETGEKIDNLQEYAFVNCMSLEATKVLFSKKTVEVCLNVVKKNGGIKSTLAKFLGTKEENLNDEILNTVIDKLPQTQEEAKVLSFLKLKFELYYDKDTDVIYLKQKIKNKNLRKMAMEVYFPVKEVKNLMEELYVSIDENIINNTEGVNKVFQAIAKKALTYKTYGKWTACDYYSYAYNYYKTGCNASIEEIQNNLGPLKKSNKYLKNFINNGVIKASKKEMVDLLSLNKLNLDRVVVSGNNNCITKKIIKIIDSSFEDLGDVWSKCVNVLLIPDKLINYGGDYLVALLEGLAIDQDIIEDNDFSCVMEINNN